VWVLAAGKARCCMRVCVVPFDGLKSICLYGLPLYVCIIYHYDVVRRRFQRFGLTERKAMVSVDASGFKV